MSQDIVIAIVGGGLSGLGVAVALSQKGFKNVNIFEKDANFDERKQGFGLTLTNNMKGPLAKLNILDEVLENDCPSYQHWVFKSTGDIIGYYGRNFKCNSSLSSNNMRGNIRIPRQVLRQIILNNLPPQIIKWDRKIKSYIESESGIEIMLESNDGLTTEKFSADLLIGADGINSIVRKLKDEYNNDVPQTPLKYIGVSVIIGLSTAEHPLIKDGGFYVLDGTHRLFVMPFRESNGKTGSQLTMWQLSFSGLTEKEGLSLKAMTTEQLQIEALRRTNNWFHPVQELILQTPLHDIWTTPLYDRDPMIMRSKSSIQELESKSQSKRKRENNTQENNVVDVSSVLKQLSVKANSCVTVLGDACHPMSMFKGQGCNQSLEDGPLLASWLSRPNLTLNNLNTRLRCFEREMLGRTSSKVLASREAANQYHSPLAMEVDYGFEGIEADELPMFLEAIKTSHINASLGKNLDKYTKDIIDNIRMKK